MQKEINFWKPQVGKNEIVLLPPINGSHLFKEVAVHYLFGVESVEQVLCKGERCPIFR